MLRGAIRMYTIDMLPFLPLPQDSTWTSNRRTNVLIRLLLGPYSTAISDGGLFLLLPQSTEVDIHVFADDQLVKITGLDYQDKLCTITKFVTAGEGRR